MRRCPYCGKEIPDSNKSVYCPVCNNIIDEDVRLRMKIEKTLKEPKKQETRKTEPVMNYRATEQEEESHGAGLKILAAVVVIGLLAAAWYFFLR